MPTSRYRMVACGPANTHTCAVHLGKINDKHAHALRAFVSISKVGCNGGFGNSMSPTTRGLASSLKQDMHAGLT